MSDNVLQTLQHLVQDVIAPDVRELKVRIGSLEKQVDLLREHMDIRFAAADGQASARDEKRDAQFKALLSAVSESRAQGELTNIRVLAALSERVAVLEAKRQ